MADKPSILGRLSAVRGAQAVARFGKEAFGETQEDGKDGLSQARVGDLVRVKTPASMVYGIVNSLTISEFDNKGIPQSGLMEMDLIGEILIATDTPTAGFQRGISIAPALGAAVMAASEDDAGSVYAVPTKAHIKVGKIHQSDNITAHLLIDDLLNKHFAILGTTGSGKSCAVTLFLHAILNACSHGHIIMLDPHDEYKTAFGDQAELINIDNVQLPYWMLVFDELKEILVSKTPDTRDSEIRLLKDAILKARKEHSEDSDYKGYITVDTPVPFRMSALKTILNAEMGTLNKADSSAPYMRLAARIDSLSSDPRYAFMFAGVMVRDILSDIMSRLLRIPVSGKPITIIDLSGVPGEITDVVVSVLCRTIFDFAVWNQKKQQVPVLLVCEEAHRYIPEQAETGFEPTKKAIAQIAKEGRKYGVSLCLISQRPSELSTSILSQCGTLVALRMSNDKDLAFVRSALPEGSTGLLAVLPALRSQEAVIVGEGVTVPVRVSLDTLAPEHLPRSGSASFSTAWQDEAASADLVSDTVHHWRQQIR